MQGPTLSSAAGSLIEGYSSVTPLEDGELAILPELLAARLVALITIAAWRVRSFPENEDYIMGSVAEATALLEWLDDLGYERAADAFAVPLDATPTDDLRTRRSVLGSAMSDLSYEEPLHLVRGEGMWLIAANGERFLDCYNNVPVVGHSHPHVTDAIARNARLLNTNLRYLHRNSIELAERLTATLPDGLDVCMFVNSGSEANDVALQLAAVATGHSGAVVTEFAYHGVTAAVADLSPEHWATGYTPERVVTIPPPRGDGDVPMLDAALGEPGRAFARSLRDLHRLGVHERRDLHAVGRVHGGSRSIDT